jgi:hypothetical protein
MVDARQINEILKVAPEQDIYALWAATTNNSEEGPLTSCSMPIDTKLIINQ